MKKILAIIPLTILCLILNAQQIFKSPNGEKRVIINKISENKFQVIVNNTRHNIYKKIVNQKIYFFGDSYDVAYIAKCEDGYCVVINGVEQKHYKAIIFNKIEFSPDSMQYAYSARIKMRLNSADICWVINGEERILYNVSNLSNITFSPDSKHWAYAVKNNKGGGYIIDGLEQTKYNDIALTSFTFSPDSKHWKYQARKDNNWFYIIDGKETKNENTALFTSYQLPLIYETHVNDVDFNSDTDSITELAQHDVPDTLMNNEISNQEYKKSIAYNLYSSGYRDLVITNKGDSLICKIRDEDSSKVYISLFVNETEVEKYIVKDNIITLQKDFYTSRRKSKSKVSYYKENAVKGSYLSFNPCIINIGGDFNGELFSTKEIRGSNPYIDGVYGRFFIPKINPGIGYNIKCGIIRKYKYLGFGIEASYIRSKHNSSWMSYDMKVKYTSMQATLSLLCMISDDIIWNLSFTYPWDNLEIKDGEWVVTNWEPYTVEIAGDSKFHNSDWNPIPFNIGSSLDFFINKSFMFFAGFDYQVSGKYEAAGMFSDHYYNNSGYELSNMSGLSSKLLNINFGVKLFFIKR